jgi:hypothetical protein
VSAERDRPRLVAIDAAAAGASGRTDGAAAGRARRTDAEGDVALDARVVPAVVVRLVDDVVDDAVRRWTGGRWARGGAEVLEDGGGVEGDEKAPTVVVVVVVVVVAIIIIVVVAARMAIATVVVVFFFVDFRRLSVMINYRRGAGGGGVSGCVDAKRKAGGNNDMVFTYAVLDTTQITRRPGRAAGGMHSSFR